MESVPQFSTLLQSLTAADNDTRNNAEAVFNQLNQEQPTSLVASLVGCIRQSEQIPSHLRALGSVLLRRTLLRQEPTIWERLSDDSQSSLKSALLELLITEKEPAIKRRLAEIIGELAAELLDSSGEAGWPEVITLIFETLRAGATVRDEDKEVGLQLFTCLGDFMASSAAQSEESAYSILTVLHTAISEGNGPVRLSAARALSAVLGGCGGEEERSVFAPCLKPLLEALDGAARDVKNTSSYTGGLRAGGSNSADKLLRGLLEVEVVLACLCPRFFKPMLQAAVCGAVAIASDTSLASLPRQTSLEFLVTLAEEAPAMCRQLGRDTSPASEELRKQRRAKQRRSSISSNTSATSNNERIIGTEDLNSFAAHVIPVCFKMMGELVEEPGWGTSEEEEGSDSTFEAGNACSGAESLDRISRSLGPKASFPTCYRLIAETLRVDINTANSENGHHPFDEEGEGRGKMWAVRHSGLTAVAQVAEAVASLPSARQEIPELVAASLQYLRHPHPRVRHAAITALGQMATDHAPNFQNDHHMTVVPGLIRALGATDPSGLPGVEQCPRVRALAAAALVNFLEQCPQEIAVIHLNTILNASVQQLPLGPRIVLEQLVTVIGSVAEVVGDAFVPHYHSTMPIVKEVLTLCNSRGKAYQLVRAKALECLSIIGLASGKELFFCDALAIMDDMVNVQASGLEDDDPLKTYLSKAWVRISKCLGTDFSPYLPLVMPPLLEAISAPISSTDHDDDSGDERGDGDSSDDENDMNSTAGSDEYDSDMECGHGNGGRITAVRCTALEVQATGCQMILLLAESLQELFFPWVEATARALSHLATSSPHDDVRTYAMAALPEMVRSTAKAVALEPQLQSDRQSVVLLLEFCLGKLLDTLQTEPDVILVMTAAQSMRACIEHACRVWDRSVDSTQPLTPATSIPALSTPQMEILAGACVGVLQRSAQRAAVRRAEAIAQEPGEWDDEAQALALDGEAEDAELLHNMAELLGVLLRTHGAKFLPSIIPQVLPALLDMAQPYQGEEEDDENEYCDDGAAPRKAAIYALVDVVEYGSAAGVSPMLQVLVSPLLYACASDQDPSTRQAAAYGLGVVACGGYKESFAPLVSDTITALHSCISMSEEWFDHNTDVNQDDDSLGDKLAADNAAAALGRVCEYLTQRESEHDAEGKALSPISGKEGETDATSLWGQLIEWLPLRLDAVESHRLTLQICRILSSSTKSRHLVALLRADGHRLPRVLRVLAEAAVLDQKRQQQSSAAAHIPSNEETVPAAIGRVLSCIRSGHAFISAKELELALETLDTGRKGILLSLLAGYEAHIGVEIIPTCPQ